VKVVPVPEFPDYEVSNTGRVFSVSRNGSCSLRPQNNGNGYLTVSLRRRGRTFQRYIHRLVAIAFIPNPENRPTVNHKDGDKNNNDVANLEWATNSQQTLHMYRTLKRRHPSTGKKGALSFSSKKVLQFSLDGDFIALFPSLGEAAQSTGARTSCISSACSGRIKTSKGFLWKLVEDKAFDYRVDGKLRPYEEAPKKG